MRALGARSGQIVLDYSLGMAALGSPPRCCRYTPRYGWARTIARFVAMGVNFNLLSPGGPWWLVPGAAVHRHTHPGRGGVVDGLSRRSAAIVAGVGFRPLRSHGVAFADGVSGDDRLPAADTSPRAALHCATAAQGIFERADLVAGPDFLLHRTDVAGFHAIHRRVRAPNSAIRCGHPSAVAEPTAELAAWMDGIPGTAVGMVVRWPRHAVPERLRLGNPVSVIGVPDDTSSLSLDLQAGRWLDPGEPGGIVVNQALMRSDARIEARGAL
jgi:hypothetical protein